MPAHPALQSWLPYGRVRLTLIDLVIQVQLCCRKKKVPDTIVPCLIQRLPEQIHAPPKPRSRVGPASRSPTHSWQMPSSRFIGTLSILSNVLGPDEKYREYSFDAPMSTGLVIA
jgi:hypothetical protein